jgi:hypothetical protein
MGESGESHDRRNIFGNVCIGARVIADSDGVPICSRLEKCLDVLKIACNLREEDYAL